MKKITTLALVLLLLIVLSFKVYKSSSKFIIIIDTKSYSYTKKEVAKYAESVKNQGYEVEILADDWHHPDSIKKELKKRYNDKRNNLVGAVFIGDIPVPMIRDAQHFTRAFKMDQQRFSWEQSSIPSDRFYDDFDLKFEYLKKDSINTLLHYYSLKPNSSQTLTPDIFTGRIKPFNNDKKYKALKNYLTKLVAIKKEHNKTNQILFFVGHGYNSESTIARFDEKITLLEHFPWLKKQQNGLASILHSDKNPIKQVLMSELQRDDLDIALLHHHGDFDMQYLNGIPKVSFIKNQVEGIQLYLRSKMRSAKKKGKNIEEEKKRYANTYKIPEKWFDGTFDKNIIKKDSLFNANLDISLNDFNNYKPNARFVMLDACFNGAFQKDSCIASGYIFSKGKTVVTFANSVSSLQDKWANEFVGLLGLGMNVGNWANRVAYLETHIIGDPTFYFTPFDKKENVQNMINTKKSNKFWIKKLDSKYPEIQSLALKMLYKNDYQKLSSLLLKTYKENSFWIVRMQCLKLLTAYNDSNFTQCLSLAVNDSYEFIRRQALYLINKTGNKKLIHCLINSYVNSNLSSREKFNVIFALELFKKQDLLTSFDSIIKNKKNYINSKKVKNNLRKELEEISEKWAKYTSKITDKKSSEKQKMFAIRMLRNYNYHPDIEEFCNFATNTKNEKLQIAMLEALGWFNLSVYKNKIINTCNNIIDNKNSTENVKKEATKTVNRLSSNWVR